MAMRPLEKLPTIRAKLGSVIVFAVAVTLLVSYVLIAFYLRNSPRDTEEIAALELAGRAAVGPLDHIPRNTMIVTRSADGNITIQGTDLGLQVPTFDERVPHELKTPITAIRAHLENLADGVEVAAPRTLQLMLSQTERLGRLVDQLLDLSRLESGEVPFQVEVVPLAPLVSRVISEISMGRSISDVRIDDDVPPHLAAEADAERIHQVLFNLVDNAVRFTPPGGEIRVTARPDGARVQVRVTDTGVGISPEHLPRVFERFYRVDPARSRDDGGTGIGLAIARSIVEAHGGRIVAKSDPGHGSAFTFDLPAVEAAVGTNDRRVR